MEHTHVNEISVYLAFLIYSGVFRNLTGCGHIKGV